MIRVACRVRSAPAGPFHAYLSIFADKNLTFQSVTATSFISALVTLSGTEYDAFDNTGIACAVGPLSAGDVPYAEVVYKVAASPVDYHEPPGGFVLHVGTSLIPDPNLGEGYTHGPVLDQYMLVEPTGTH